MVSVILLLLHRYVFDLTSTLAELLEVLLMALKALHDGVKPMGLQVSCITTKAQVFGGLLNETAQPFQCMSDIKILEDFTYLLFLFKPLRTGRSDGSISHTLVAYFRTMMGLFRKFSGESS